MKRGLSVVGLLAVGACASARSEVPEWFEDKGAPIEIELDDVARDEAVTSTRTFAGVPEQLSIEQAAILALRNNRDLEVQNLAPVIAGTFEQIERGAFDPELFADGRFGQEQSSETARSTGEQFDVEGRGTDAQIGIRQRLPTGTDVEASLGHEFDVSDRTPEQQVVRLGLTVTQALLRGFGPAVNLAAVRQAEMEGEASLYELEGYTSAMLADTEVAYWRYVLAEKEIEIFERSLEVAREEQAAIELRIEVGRLPEMELAVAQAEVALRNQALIDARSRLEAARLTLNRYISPDPNGRLSTQLFATTDPRLNLEPIESSEERVRLSEKYRAELKESKLRVKQNRLETVVTRNGLLPKLDMFVALGKTGFGSSMGDAFGNLDEPTYEFVVGVQLSHMLMRRRAQAEDKQAWARGQQAEKAVENLEQLVRMEVLLALNELERAREQVGASAVTRAFREQAVAAERERLDVGSGTALQVAQAQRDLLVSQIAEVRAIVDCRNALVRLYQAEGTLLSRRGIVVRARDD